MVAEWRGDTMGVTAHVVVDDDAAALLPKAHGRLTDWNRRWSRFDPDSEISALNRAGGAPTLVSTDTAALLAAAVDAWHLTGGAFDPTVHDALVAAGYDRPFRDGPGLRRPTRPAPGPGDVTIDVEAGIVTAPATTRFDLGGIAKGHAADRLVAELLAAGATGACVSLGGDTAVDGACPFADAWPIHVAEHPEPIAHLRRGGFCYSTVSRRRWSTPSGPAHHLIDPRSGQPTTGTVVSVAVAAARAETAEVVATAAIVDGQLAARTRIETMGLTGFVVTTDGTRTDIDPGSVLGFPPPPAAASS